MEERMGLHRAAEWRRRGRGRIGAVGLLLGLILALGLAGCSTSGTGSGGINYSLGLAGSTADHPSQPPTIATNGPQGTYAFVYDNQIWLRQSGQGSAKQLTQLVLSNGSTIRWGPLVWSPSGKFIAFALVEDLNLQSDVPSRTDGPLYYISTDPSKPQIFITPGSGSIYGHTYDWFGDNLLMYSNGSGIQLYTLGSADPRSWQVRAIPGGPENDGGTNHYSRFGDIRIFGGYLYYTLLDIRSPGRVGTVGRADLYRTYLGPVGNYEGTDLSGILPKTDRDSVASLGLAYADNDGAYVAGAWQIRNGALALQRVQSVDVKDGQVTSQLCSVNAAPSQTFCNRILNGASKQPLALHPQFALGPGDKVAYNGDNLYIQGQSGLTTPAGWFDPAAWSPDPDGVVAYTQLVNQQTDVSGATRYTTNIQIVKGGQATTLIAGGQNPAWKP
jgi:hypothetical protein